MNVHRKRFAAALALYFVWVATLAIVAVRSARPPEERPAASAK